MKRALALIVLISALLSSCGMFSDAPDEAATPETTLPPILPELPVMPITPPAPGGDGRFSLRFNSAATLNPLVGTDASNMALGTLMYEGLFRLGPDFGYEYALCESFRTADCITYDFKLREGVLMSDGSELSPYDAVYSINTARNNRFESRLKNVASVSVSDAYTVRVVLTAADARFPCLLDFGIIKDGTSGTSPRGCGPYRYTDEGTLPRLVKNEFHEKAASLPVGTIYLVECEDIELGERFTESVIDLFSDDPNAAEIEVRRDHEKQYYNTTVLQYIGFSSRQQLVLDARFRRVVIRRSLWAGWRRRRIS